MQILKNHDQYGWITVLINERWIQAKVYDVPSECGVNGCRISKIAIAKKGVRDLGSHTGLNFFDNLDFNYDRGLDFHHQETLPQEELDEILVRLNQLPVLEGVD